MLSENEFQKYLNQNSDKIKTFLSSYGKDTLSSSSLSKVDIKNTASGVGDFIVQGTKGLNQDDLIDNFKNAVSNASRSMMKTNVKLNIDKRDIKGKGPKGSKIKQLIQLILNIVKLPKRFFYLSKSIGEATAALTLSIGGIGKSVALGIKDIYILIIAILNIIFKYFLCILSFIITTISGCLLVHLFTFFVLLIKMVILYVTDFIDSTLQINTSDTIENAFEYIQWPESINKVCYTCFGKKVKLRDILIDVRVIEDIGNTIMYDFNIRMPRYMRPGVPLGKAASRSLDKAIN